MYLPNTKSTTICHQMSNLLTNSVKTRSIFILEIHRKTNIIPSNDKRLLKSMCQINFYKHTCNSTKQPEVVLPSIFFGIPKALAVPVVSTPHLVAPNNHSNGQDFDPFQTKITMYRTHNQEIRASSHPSNRIFF